MISVSKFKIYACIAIIFFIIGFGFSYYISRTNTSNFRNQLKQARMDLRTASDKQRQLTEQIKQLRIDYSRTVERERDLLARETEHIARIRGLQNEIRAYREPINSNSEFIKQGRFILDQIRKGNK